MYEVVRTRREVYCIAVCLLLLISCFERKDDSLEPTRYETANVLTIENGQLKGIFVDNTAIGPHHRAGYNGIAQLYHAQDTSGVFVPAYAGFNLEHIFGGDSLEQLFEPRNYPMTLYRKSEDEVLLYQRSTPVSSVESLTSFKVVGPHYIDVTFECIFHDLSFFKHGYAGLFWASYINKPVDGRIFFRAANGPNPDSADWVGAWSHEHGVASTHRSAGEKYDFFFAENFNATLASHFSTHRFLEPFFYGRYRNMVLAWFFETRQAIRISQSPNGGGEGNPAWDFQYLVQEPEQDKKYSFRARIMYKPFVSEVDVQEEYRRWKK